MSAASTSSPPPESTEVENSPQLVAARASSPKQQPSPVSSPPHEPALICLWVDCGKPFPEPELLYNHLCNAHIGRKSTNNLCLTCKWKDCGATCAKRDHITSHLRGNAPPPRVHVWRPLANLSPPNSPYAAQTSCLRDMQEVVQTSSGSEETRKDPHRGAPCPAQTLESDHSRRPGICVKGKSRDTAVESVAVQASPPLGSCQAFQSKSQVQLDHFRDDLRSVISWHSLGKPVLLTHFLSRWLIWRPPHSISRT